MEETMSDRPLKSLASHNAAAGSFYDRPTVDVPNGIACPACGAELVDVDRSCVLTSAPPKYAASCLACRWRGYRTC